MRSARRREPRGAAGRAAHDGGPEARQSPPRRGAGGDRSEEGRPAKSSTPWAADCPPRPVRDGGFGVAHQMSKKPSWWNSDSSLFEFKRDWRRTSPSSAVIASVFVSRSWGAWEGGRQHD